MPVNSESASYQDFVPQWQRVRDCVSGQDAVKARGDVYLPKPEAFETSTTIPQALGQVTEYNSYLLRAMFYEATGRTVLGLIGSILRKPPQVAFVDRLKDSLDDVNEQGDDIQTLLHKMVADQVSVSRQGVLVDAPAGPSVTPEPYLAVYPAESIINWRSDKVDGRRTTTMVVLREMEPEDDADDDFEVESEEQYRVLRFGYVFQSRLAMTVEEAAWLGDPAAKMMTAGQFLAYYQISDSETAKPMYWQELWVKVGEDETTAQNTAQSGEAEVRFVLQRRIFPRMVGGKLWDEMPWDFCNASDTDAEPAKPVLLGLVDINLAHYRNAADLEHGLHFTGLPTPWAAGFDLAKGANLALGSSRAWVAENAQAHCGFLEFTGQGLKALEEALDRKEMLMAILGARLLEQQKDGVESADAINLRHRGETSVLVTMANTVTTVMTRALQRLARWLGATDAEIEKVSCKLNTDFNTQGLEPKQIIAYMHAYQGGVLSFEQFFHNMEKGEVYAPGTTLEDERAKINAGMPSLLETLTEITAAGTPTINPDAKPDSLVPGNTDPGARSQVAAGKGGAG